MLSPSRYQQEKLEYHIIIASSYCPPTFPCFPPKPEGRISLRNSRNSPTIRKTSRKGRPRIRSRGTTGGPNPGTNQRTQRGNRLQPPHRTRTSLNGKGFGDDLLVEQGLALGLLPLQTTLAQSLVLGTLGVHLLLEDAVALALSLGLLDL